ncbi:hypothetical protein UlMin_005063 [Ulmus minor]
MASTSTVESSRTENSEDIEKILFDKIMNREWEEVFNMYGKYQWARNIKITNSGDTILHVAISHPEFEEKYKVVKKLLQHIKKDSDPFDVLKLENEKGRTPLHRAASFGLMGRMCKICIDSVGDVEKASKLVRVRDKKGQTPLFMAVHYGRLKTFLYLHSILGDTGGNSSFCVRDDGRSILHDAIIKENFDLAFQIIHLYKGLVHLYDKQGVSPLHVLARKASAFRSGSTLRRGSKIIYDCIHVEELNPPDSNYVEKNNVEFGTNIDIESGEVNRREYVEKECRNVDIESDEGSNIARENQPLIWCRNTSCFGYFLNFVITKMAFIFGYGDTAVRKIYAEKEKHVWADQVLKEIFEHASMNDMKLLSLSVAGKDKSSKIKKPDTALLIAAKYGIVEMVERIIEKFPLAIYDVDQERKNILLVAVENRHLKIYKLLLKKYSGNSVILQKMDKKGNNALHFAATYGRSARSWPVPGAALQMQWEIKWLEFVEKTMPPLLFLRTNKIGQTPREIFTDSHKDLVKAGGEWLIGTATSCSVVAALIVTIAYASSTTVPGGDTGKPKLRHIPTFELFAVASLAALCFSVTSLITFLAILTSRHEEQDFEKSLPRKILLGLTSLFVSIAAMLLTFSAGHFILFEDEFKYAAFPVYAVIFLPLCLFAAAQFPLYVDIFRATFWSPF